MVIRTIMFRGWIVRYRGEELIRITNTREASEEFLSISSFLFRRMLIHQASNRTRTKPVITARCGKPSIRENKRLYKGTGPSGTGTGGGYSNAFPQRMSPISPITRYWIGKLDRKKRINMVEF